MQGGIKWKELKDASISDWGRSLIYPAVKSVPQQGNLIPAAL